MSRKIKWKTEIVMFLFRSLLVLCAVKPFVSSVTALQVLLIYTVLNALVNAAILALVGDTL